METKTWHYHCDCNKRREQPTHSLQQVVPQMRSDKLNKEDTVKPKENTVPVIIGKRKPPSRSKRWGTYQNPSLIHVSPDGIAEDKPGDTHRKVCTVNTQLIRYKTRDVVEHVLSNKIDIYMQWQKHGWNRPTMPLDKSVSLLAIHSQIISTKWQDGLRHRPIVQVKSHTIFGAIRREKIIWVLWMAYKMSISCHEFYCCLSTTILKWTSNHTSQV